MPKLVVKETNNDKRFDSVISAQLLTIDFNFICFCCKCPYGVHICKARIFPIDESRLPSYFQTVSNLKNLFSSEKGLKMIKRTFLLTSIIILLIYTTTNSAFAKYQYGNIILSKNQSKLKSTDQKPVVFPHWIHSMWFKCKACHDNPFAMEKGKTNITMKEINEGKKCGICHNGKSAFSSEECTRCHSLKSNDVALTLNTSSNTSVLYPKIYKENLTKKEEQKNENLIFSDPHKVSMKEYKKIADKLNVSWNPQYIAVHGIPKDKYGFIDWQKMIFKDRGIELKSSISRKRKERVRKNLIVFEVLSDFVDNVPFSHTEHSYLIDCDTCHEKVFKIKLGANEVHMRRNTNGEFCGYCHSKVAFPLSDCKRCHNLEKGKGVDFPGKVLIRKNPLASKKLTVKGGDLIVEEVGD